ncbi:MAG: Peptide-methionine (S)-S-oxide reductase MsrA [uncultured Solirubrobacteraceae bacterium]|uniref:Peptide-methionine (S)-S-oxide reductase MsrA n=1 Tax=uncultured Solirubrobacteraceae bacterium TaxID=1162706 RepID=A0A6J4SF40_9ACTN|nr:MAG: Peptide-methionine (S)-S-oxide reductase MsrA [uncultured Solirubrobacteraceae bacterium]
MAQLEPLGPAELGGHVIVVSFWTLTCINWLRQEPYPNGYTCHFPRPDWKLPDRETVAQPDARTAVRR